MFPISRFIEKFQKFIDDQEIPFELNNLLANL